MRLLTCALLGIGVMSASASAGPLAPGVLKPDKMAWFYNRPGATAAELETDRAHCTRFANLMATATETPTNQAGLVGVALWGTFVSAPVNAYVDDCLIAEGYRRYHTADKNLDALVKRVTAMTPQQQAALVGAEKPPEGELARQWVNTYWKPANGEPASAPEAHRVIPNRVPASNGGKPDRETIEPLKQVTDAGVEGSDVTLVLSLSVQSRQPVRVYFMRDKIEDGSPDVATFGKNQRWPTLQATGKPGTPAQVVFRAPAGTYSLAAVGPTRFASATFMCMGTVVFTAQPGDVLYLGEYSVSDDPGPALQLTPPPKWRMRIDTAQLEAGRSALASAPAAAAKLKPAAYANGFPHACPVMPGAAVWGLDIPGAPQWTGKPTSATSN